MPPPPQLDALACMMGLCGPSGAPPERRAAAAEACCVPPVESAGGEILIDEFMLGSDFHRPPAPAAPSSLPRGGAYSGIVTATPTAPPEAAAAAAAAAEAATAAATAAAMAVAATGLEDEGRSRQTSLQHRPRNVRFERLPALPQRRDPPQPPGEGRRRLRAATT